MLSSKILRICSVFFITLAVVIFAGSFLQQRGSSSTGMFLPSASNKNTNLSKTDKAYLALSSTTLIDSDFVVDDQIVSDLNQSIFDYEFNQKDFLLTWIDQKGNLWVGQVNPSNGDFIPQNGKGTLVDTGASPIFGAPTINRRDTNGPEWAFGTNGAQIVYNKLVNYIFNLASARWTGTGWEATLLENGDHRLNPIGSKGWNDPNPRIVYTDQRFSPNTLNWRYINNSSSEEIISTGGRGRWIGGSHILTTNQVEVDNRQECGLYNIDTRTQAVVSSETGEKGSTWAWRAPEFNMHLVDFCAISVEGSRAIYSSISIYRHSNRTWTKINSLQSPSPDYPYIDSPEPFVYNNRSYVFFVAKQTSDKNSMGQVWIASIDPSFPFYRQVSDDSIKSRFDPEALQTESGLYIYYTEIVQKKGITHRCATGLGLPLQ
jgi:hypothetical protein